jgi:hypothetical protein
MELIEEFASTSFQQPHRLLQRLEACAPWRNAFMRLLMYTDGGHSGHIGWRQV